MIIDYIGKKWDISDKRQKQMVLGMFRAKLDGLYKRRDLAIKSLFDISEEEREKLFGEKAHNGEKYLLDLIAKIELA